MQVGRNIGVALACIAFLWAVYLMGLLFPLDIRAYGIVPRDTHRFYGVLFSPFLHAGVGHLLANSSALAVLLSASLIYSRKLTVKAVLVIVLAGGVCVWLLGRSNTVYIGSSGVIYGLMGYLMAVGLFRRELTALLVSLIVFLYYGGALPSLFLVVPGVSWSAHFFGFLSGVGAAWLTRYENKGYASNRRALSRF